MQIVNTIPEIDAIEGSNELKILNVIPAEIPANKELKNLYVMNFLVFILNFLDNMSFLVISQSSYF